MVVQFTCVEENNPGEKWLALFNKTWPFYQQWFLSEELGARKGYLSSFDRLQHYMPELIPIYIQLTQLVGGGDIESRFLTMYCPPPYMSGCSQMYWGKGEPFIIRNYDYNPKLIEGVLLKTNWLKPVIGMSDCNWGLLDGMNADGLSASLAFGGKKVSGEGFGIPLIIRYLLETTSNVAQAIAQLKLIPVHMPYNITLADSTGNFATVFVAPDKEPVITNSPSATNHQSVVEWQDYARLTGTVERLNLLESVQLNTFETEQSIVEKFLSPPLFSSNYNRNFGTLYTSQYYLNQKKVCLYWQHKRYIVQSFLSFHEENISIDLTVQPVVNQLL